MELSDRYSGVMELREKLGYEWEHLGLRFRGGGAWTVSQVHMGMGVGAEEEERGGHWRWEGKDPRGQDRGWASCKDSEAAT